MGVFDFFRSFANETEDSSLVSKIRKDRVNVIVELNFLFHDSYIMVLDFVYDKNLISRIKEEQIDASELIRIATRRGIKVDSPLDVMIRLSEVVNEEDLILRVEDDGDSDSITAKIGFFH
ncbi:MAG: hypothetical protein IJ845_08430 [Bacteroidaceae bacterium]|nr:hypothetical protein [Bacteroidaceae bacterium]